MLTYTNLVKLMPPKKATDGPVRCIIGHINDRTLLLTLPGVRETTTEKWSRAVMLNEAPPPLMWDDPLEGTSKPVWLAWVVTPREIIVVHKTSEFQK